MISGCGNSQKTNLTENFRKKRLQTIVICEVCNEFLLFVLYANCQCINSVVLTVNSPMQMCLPALPHLGYILLSLDTNMNKLLVWRILEEALSKERALYGE